MEAPSPSSSPNNNKPIHSLNCFILFRAEFCKESNLRGEDHSGAQLSKRAAAAWGGLALEEKKPWRNLANLKQRQCKLEQELHPLSVVIPSMSTSSFSTGPPASDADFPMSDETFLSCFSALSLRDPMEESNHRFGSRPEIYPLES
ncbi:hypothetical protein PM082_015136 [Marasmius tenuissimus]|nr:hypothetical protein PM082_015136 [Marasmius tenuissimus]